MVYIVKSNDFFNLIEQSDIPDGGEFFKNNKALVRDPIQQLTERYNIKGKSILSVGTFFGFEEYWFVQNKNNLVCIDIDEKDQIEPILKNVESSSRSENSIDYFIGDAEEYLKLNEAKFNIVYISSFTPDEFYKRQTNKQNKLSYYIKKFFLKIGFLSKYLETWPKDKSPFSEQLMKLINQSVKQNGLFICQSYASGVSISQNESFILKTKEQFSKNNFELLEFYHYKNFSQVYLIIAFKGSKAQAKEIFDKNFGKQIQKFHGRGKLDDEVILAYSILDISCK